MKALRLNPSIRSGHSSALAQAIAARFSSLQMREITPVKLRTRSLMSGSRKVCVLPCPLSPSCCGLTHGMTPQPPIQNQTDVFRRSEQNPPDPLRSGSAPSVERPYTSFKRNAIPISASRITVSTVATGERRRQLRRHAVLLVWVRWKQVNHTPREVESKSGNDKRAGTNP
jgi:hypothetical protein